MRARESAGGGSGEGRAGGGSGEERAGGGGDERAVGGSDSDDDGERGGREVRREGEERERGERKGR